MAAPPVASHLAEIGHGSAVLDKLKTPHQGKAVMLSAYLRKPWASGKHVAALLPLLAFVCALIAPDRDRAADARKPEAGAGPAAWVGDLSPIGAADWNRARAAHLLERAGFGGTPEEIDRLAKMTPQEAVDYLVDYDKLKDNLPPFNESGIYR